VSPKLIAEFIGWLVKQPNGRGGALSDKNVRNALGPLQACLATAKREGEIPSNLAAGSALPHRPRIEADEELPRPLPKIDEDDGACRPACPLGAPRHVRTARSDRLRRSELLALEVRHLHLDGDAPHVKIGQRTRWQ
jgi:integrase